MYGYPPTGYGAGRDAITQALMNVRNPPPGNLQPPPVDGLPSLAPQQSAATQGMPGVPTGPIGGAQPPGLQPQGLQGPSPQGTGLQQGLPSAVTGGLQLPGVQPPGQLPMGMAPQNALGGGYG